MTYVAVLRGGDDRMVEDKLEDFLFTSEDFPRFEPERASKCQRFKVKPYLMP